jgi:hypothetical protein
VRAAATRRDSSHAAGLVPSWSAKRRASGANLLVDWAFVPEVPEERRGELWPNMSYDADVSPRGWNQGVSDFGGFERPVPEARRAWLDFFRPDYDWKGHFDRHGQPDSD